ncbi:glycoside hydrolase family 27 protein [Lentithecium fluviatile CBS 122367]|uniref:Alpha-galactosidase n=1 Tax=Lentithecium fluviatile CBS 122367 TaxID=1168545 RepID=A0A6G1IXJ2_9PLEO|nr:glycoside hydrolase family 27 protein [Lentithecium fluviatile CBS 122367]
MKFALSLLVICAFQHTSLAAPSALTKRLENGLGRTPALGYNNWNNGGCTHATAESALNVANLLISLGLKDAGYTYVNTDDCWSSNSRNSTGHLVPDPTKWPQGIKPVADEIHSMGLKFGLYGDAGIMTCAGYPGSQGHEVQDALTLAEWDVDYWKHDACYLPCGDSGDVPQGCYDPNSSTKPYYGIMRDALAEAGRPIFFSICNWGRDSVWTWGKDYGNSWRMSNDIANNWGSVASIAARAAGIAEYAGPGGFNDLDMLQVGNGGLNENEERAHVGLWAIAKSPLLIGTDLSKLQNSTLNILKNKALIAINQDTLGKAATYFQPAGASAPVDGSLYPYWAGPLSDGVVVGIVASEGAANLSVSFADVPGLGSGSWEWSEAFTGATGEGTGVSADLPAHDMRVYKVSKGTLMYSVR